MYVEFTLECEVASSVIHHNLGKTSSIVHERLVQRSRFDSLCICTTLDEGYKLEDISQDRHRTRTACFVVGVLLPTDVVKPLAKSLSPAGWTDIQCNESEKDVVAQRKR